MTISTVSERFDIPRNHLVKIVHRLGKLGHIETIQGKGGGIRLARSSDDISLRSLVNDMEERLTPVNCHKPLCPISPSCKLSAILAEAQAAFMEVLGNYSLSDLRKNPEELKQLLKIYPSSP